MPADLADSSSENKVFRPFQALPESSRVGREIFSYYDLYGDKRHTSFYRGYTEYRLSNGSINFADFREVQAQTGRAYGQIVRAFVCCVVCLWPPALPPKNEDVALILGRELGEKGARRRTLELAALSTSYGPCPHVVADLKPSLAQVKQQFACIVRQKLQAMAS